jgi:hypothetical protein
MHSYSKIRTEIVEIHDDYVICNDILKPDPNGDMFFSDIRDHFQWKSEREWAIARALWHPEWRIVSKYMSDK